MKKMNIKYTWALLLAALLGTTATQAQTQQVHYLDLESSIAIAKMKSFDMLSLKEDLNIAQYNLKSATSRFKTHVDLDLTLPQFNNALEPYTDSDGSTKLLPSRKSTYNGQLTISQPLPTDGRIYVTSGFNNIDNYLWSNRIMTMSTRIGLSQPVNAFYYNDIRSSYKRAELNYEQTQKRLKREELNLVYNVSNAFYSLLSLQKREDIARMNLERQKEAYTTAKNKYDAGLIREVDALQMEVDLAEAQNNYDVAIISRQASLNNFKEIIGVSLQDSVILSSNLDYKIVAVDAGKAVELAMQNRSEIREQEIRLQLNKIDIKRQKSYGMATGNINASYQRMGANEGPMGNDFMDAVNSTFDDFRTPSDNAGLGIGFTVNIPIIDWGENKALVRAAEARLQQNMYQQEVVKRSIESEVMNLVADLNSSLKRLQLLEKNVSVAEKSFEITRARFSDGDIDSQALALERDRLNNAYVTHLSAYINYQLKIADLMRKTFYDFQNDRPIQ